MLNSELQNDDQLACRVCGTLSLEITCGATECDEELERRKRLDANS